MKSSDLLSEALHDLTDHPIERHLRTTNRPKLPPMKVERNLASDKEVFNRILDRFSQLNNAFRQREQFETFASTRLNGRATSLPSSRRYHHTA